MALAGVAADGPLRRRLSGCGAAGLVALWRVASSSARE